MSSIEHRLHRLSVEALLKRKPNDPDRVEVERMARSVNGQKAADRLSTVEVDLDSEWLRQANILADICVPLLSTPRRKVSRQQYIESWPHFVEQSAELKNLLPIYLIVETRIPWPKFAEAADISVDDYLRSSARQVRDWKADPQRFKTPKKPYTTSIQDGSRLVNLKPSVAREQITSIERGGTLYDGISMVIVRPDIARGKGWDLIGQQVGSGNVPSLHWFDGRPRLDAYWDVHAHPNFRALVCGRKIGT